MLQSELFPSDRTFTRRDAAKICHEYLREVLGEADEENISGAAVLKDLYDCGVCVNHIAQVYLKGIIVPVSKRLFGNDEILSSKEIGEIFLRLEKKELRIVPSLVQAEVKRIAREDIKTLMPVMVVDVRTNREYEEEHPEGALNIPLSKYVLNPHALGSDKFADYVFICEEGANALIAANCAHSAGYVSVFYSSYNGK